MRVILGTTKDTPIKAMRYLLDLPAMEARHKVEQVKVYLNDLSVVLADEKNARSSHKLQGRVALPGWSKTEI